MNSVSQTAKLMGVTGSGVERNKLASNLNKRYYFLINDVFETRAKKGKPARVTALEMARELRKLADGVVFFFDKNTDKTVVASVEHEQLQGKINSIYAHSINLPFAKRGGVGSIGKDKLDIWVHELRHFFDVLTQPKMLARENSFQRLKNKALHWKMYSKNIYTDNEKVKDKSQIIPEMKNQIEAHFDKYKTSQKDRIEVLQYWRYQLQSEANAAHDQILYPLHVEYKVFKEDIKNDVKLDFFIEGTEVKFHSNDYTTRKDKLNALATCKKLDFDYKYDTAYRENYYFDEKIKLVEEMLAQNLTEVRAKHKRSLELMNKGSR